MLAADVDDAAALQKQLEATVAGGDEKPLPAKEKSTAKNNPRRGTGKVSAADLAALEDDDDDEEEEGEDWPEKEAAP